MKVRGGIGSGACGKKRCEIARWVRETQACGCKAHAGAGVGMGATRAGGGTCRLDVRRRCPPRTSRRKSTGRCGRGPSPSPSNQGRDTKTQLRFDAQRARLVRVRVRAREVIVRIGLQACIAITRPNHWTWLTWGQSDCRAGCACSAHLSEQECARPKPVEGAATLENYWQIYWASYWNYTSKRFTGPVNPVTGSNVDTGPVNRQY